MGTRKVKNFQVPNALNTILSVIGAITGIFALFFSWQANQLSEKAVTDNVVFLYSRQVQGVEEWNEDHTEYVAHCGHAITVANVGGAVTNILEARANVYHKELLLKANLFTDDGSSKGTYAEVNHERFEIYGIDIVKGIQNGDFVQVVDEEIDWFPIQIDANATRVIISLIEFAIVGKTDADRISYSGPGYRVSRDYIGEVPEEAEDALMVTYTFHLSSGKKVTTSPMFCATVELE